MGCGCTHLQCKGPSHQPNGKVMHHLPWGTCRLTWDVWLSDSRNLSSKRLWCDGFWFQNRPWNHIALGSFTKAAGTSAYFRYGAPSRRWVFVLIFLSKSGPYLHIWPGTQPSGDLFCSLDCTEGGGMGAEVCKAKDAKFLNYPNAMFFCRD